MLSNPLEKALYDQICLIPTVDAHEHLHSEEMRVERQVDIFLLFHQYLCTQLVSAGMDAQAAEALGDETTPLDQKWDSLAPYLDLVRDCGCARPPYEALNLFFGEEDLTADNYADLSRRMQHHNQPGLFERCLREACNIVLVLNQNRTMWQNEVFKPILPEDSFISVCDRAGLEALAEAAGVATPTSLDALCASIETLVTRHAKEGMIGVKGMCYPYTAGDREAAGAALGRVIADDRVAGDAAALQDYLRDVLYDLCGRLGLVVVKHSGVWSGGWTDHTNIRPTFIMPVAAAHRETRFDLFHAGTPWPEDAALIARGYPNVWLNLCWSHLISPSQAERALDVWLDEVPINRVFAFGGDYWWAVENVYGALAMTREIVARVLARSVKRHSMTETRALQIAQRWFHDNPREVYGV